MAIQIKLLSNTFNHSGKYNGREYTSLQIKRTSNGRIYFSIINNGIRLCEMAKQMKLEDGKAVVSFGKNDKLIVGTYDIDCEELKEEKEEEKEAQPVQKETEESFKDGTITDQSDNQSPNETLKVDKKKEKVLLKKYMGNGFDEHEGQYFEYDTMGFYLVKSNKSWCIVEKKTKLFVVTWRKKKKEVFEEFKDFMAQHSEKVKRHIAEKTA